MPSPKNINNQPARQTTQQENHAKDWEKKPNENAGNSEMRANLTGYKGHAGDWASVPWKM